MKKCSIGGCDKHAAVRDLCGMHYARLKRHGTTDAPAKFFGTPQQRFWTKVEKSDGCWEWNASKHRDGYGLFNAGAAGYVMAHRFSFELHKGPIPDGKCVCHHCDNPACVNPAHLFIGSHKENMDDRDAKGRVAAGEANGVAKLTESQVMAIREDGRTTREIGKGLRHLALARLEHQASWIVEACSMKPVLRPYQRAAIDALYQYFHTKAGNPVLVLPTGAGKSLTMAAFIQEAIEQYPTTRILLLTHVRELIQQDAQAIIRYWPEAPIGIWAAGLGKKVKHQITVAGIQSIHKMPAKFGGTDLVIIDEAHLLSKNSDTMYGRFLTGLRQHNPYLKVIGLTATPYRMDSGILIEGEHRVFTDIAYEAGVGDLIKDGWLCPLVARNGATKADLSDVHTRGGEFVANELQQAMDKEYLIQGALDEVGRYAHDRNHILGFCAGVEHAAHCAEASRARGWTADYVTGDMAPGERDAKINAFKEGRTRILFNAMLLTTGFDAPHIDCIVMLRPTKSTGLYVQIMGRGLRKHPSKENTLILDFAGNVERHGPIDQIKVKRKAEKGEGVSVAPVKECPNCQALVHAGVRECPECGNLFPENESAKHGTEAADAVVVAALEKPRTYTVDRVEYERYSKIGKPDSIKVTYWCGPSTFSEWLPILDERSYVKKHYIAWCWHRGIVAAQTIEEFLTMVEEQRIPQPETITVKLSGKYWQVMDAKFNWRKTA